MTQKNLVTRSWSGALAASVLVVGCSGMVGCKKKEVARPAPEPSTYSTPIPAPPAAVGVSFRELRVGKALNADKTVTTDLETFAPRDTIYASVATSGSAATAPIRAVWTFQDGQVVSDDTQTITATGADTTEFHISKPDGFPAGSYKVAISIDGLVVMNRDFKVQ
ncbi:MAG: hypothetical protein ABIV06_13250 [Thermoanaerobaculia bacterium]